MRHLAGGLLPASHDDLAVPGIEFDEGLIFLGYVVGPAAFAALVAATGRFDLAFGCGALVTLPAIFGLLGPSEVARLGR